MFEQEINKELIKPKNIFFLVHWNQDTDIRS
jgi:hypothetical protein